MNEGLIQKIIQRSNRGLLALGLLAILITGALLALNTRYFYNFFLGPFEATPAQLLPLQAGDRPLQYWVTVRGEDLLDTGMQYVTTSDSGKENVDFSYMALILENRLLMVKYAGEIPTTPMEPVITGWLIPIRSDEESEVIQAVEKDVPQVAGAFLPYQIQTGNFRTNGIIGLVIATAALIGGLWAVLIALRRINDPNTHPILKALTRFGPLDFVVNRVESELAVPHDQIGGLHLANSWLVFDGKTNLQATRYEDIAWVYQHVLTQRSYGIVVNKVYTIMVYDCHGVRLNITAGRKEQEANRMLQAIYERASWAVAGYSKELEHAWGKDRPGFLAAVARRKTPESYNSFTNA